MRSRKVWPDAFIDKFKKVGIPIKVSAFLRTELMLYALCTYFPEQPIRKGHLLLQGYREKGISDHQWRILQHLRHLTPEFVSSISWEQALRDYNSLMQDASRSWLGFELNF